jgi:hypothetical protein
LLLGGFSKGGEGCRAGLGERQAPARGLVKLETGLHNLLRFEATAAVRPLGRSEVAVLSYSVTVEGGEAGEVGFAGSAEVHGEGSLR